MRPSLKQSAKTWWMGLITLVVMGHLSTPLLAQDDSFQPIIQLSTSLKLDSVKQESLWDKEYRRNRTRNKYAIKGLRNQIKQLEAALADGGKQGSKRTADRLRLLEAYVNLYNFEMSQGEDKDKDGKRAALLDSLFRKTARLGNDLADTAEKPQDKARGAFHAQLAKYYGRSTDFNLHELDAYQKSMRRDLWVQARLLEAIDAVEHGTEQARYDAIKRLEPVTRYMNERQGIVANLMIAQTVANIDGEGNLLRDPAPDYKPYLTKASDLGAKLAKAQKREVFLYALSLWRIAERDQGSWENLPIDLSAYQDMPEIKSARERVAISLAQKKSYMAAAKIYQEIRQVYAKTPLVIKVDERLLNLYRYDYVANGNPKAYQAMLNNLQRRYSNAKVTKNLPEADVKAFLGKMDGFYQELASNEANRGLDDKAGSETRAQALQVLNARLRSAKSASEKESIQYQMASLLVLAKKYGEANAIFTKLANQAGTSKANRTRYLLLALQTRQAALNWPADNPYPQMSQKEPLDEARSKDLNELLSLSQKYEAATKGSRDSHWPIVAQIGVLQAKLGKGDAAVKLWWDTLKRDAKGPYAEEAAGQSIRLLKEQGKWSDLEAFTRFLAESNITPGLDGKAVDLRSLLASSLFQSARQSEKERRYALAIKRYQDYVENFGNEKNHDEAMVRLAECYRKAGYHTKALAVFSDLTQTHPRSPYTKKVLDVAGDYALGLGMEEEAAKLYERSLRQRRDGPGVAVVAEKLARLQVATSRVDMATKTLLDVLRRKQLLPEQVSALGALLIDIQSRYGSPKQAQKVAEFFKKVAPDNPLADMKIALFQARQMVDGAYEPKLANQLDKMLEGMPDKPDETMVEDVAEIRFILADKRGEDLVESMDNGSSDNPLKVMEGHFKAFKAMEIAFLKVCDLGENSFCGPSQYKLYKLADQFVNIYGEYDASDSLNGKRLKHFQTRRRALIKEVTQIRDVSRNIAVKEVAKGATSQEWAQEIGGIDKKGTGGGEWDGMKVKLFAQVDTKLKDKAPRRPKSLRLDKAGGDAAPAQAEAVKDEGTAKAQSAKDAEPGDEASADAAKPSVSKKVKGKKGKKAVKKGAAAKAAAGDDDGSGGDEDW